MASFAVSATQFTGQALIRTASALAINQATSFISRSFDTRNFEGPRLESFHLQTSRDGAPMARIFGRVRLAGQVIWASHVRESSTETPVGGKGGGPTQTEYRYSISLAIGLCEGEIAGIDRIWANGAPLETAGLDMRVYRGGEEQGVDPIIAATEGGDAPAFRGTAYVVFEDFPLKAYGNRLPQMNFEILRSGARRGRLESLIESVNLLPGSGEFAYATEIIEEGIRPGETRPLNMNNLSGKADIDLALDQLQAQLPNCRNVSIISSWFASSVEIGACEIRPGIERRVRNIRNAVWQAGGETRNSAFVVSEDADGRPNFGGTPSDDSLIQAIKSIKARGMTVTIYPFILVDVSGFPWRGRMTGEAADVAGFFGGQNGFRNFILSHADLAKRAGGVDRFIIGSEMIGLTTIRDGQNAFPAVTELAQLAADVRAVLGPQTGLTYAADWSEYFGFHPQDGSGDVFFHLDELWAHPAIDAIGIDAYIPLSDWREGEHLDGQIFDSIYDPNYLTQNIEGGEGYEWYYPSTADRDAQNRAPISDWVYRYKDLRNWWLNAHRNRIGGAQQPATQWVPQSKPFWLTEVGCPAVSFGSNQPNLFSDGKSVESKFPYYSSSYPDNLIQRRYLETLIGYWASPKNNPVSNVTGLPMIETSATAVWAWDARPFPDFPARLDIWADGENWQAGHWINGRVGAVPIQDVIAEICAEAGIESPDVSDVVGLLSGFVIDRPMRARDALSPLLEAYDLTVSEQAGRVCFAALSSQAVRSIQESELIVQEGGPIRYQIDDDMVSLRDVRLTYIDAARDYQMATTSARHDLSETVRIAELQAPIVMDETRAKIIAKQQLARSEPARRSASFSMPLHSAPAVGNRVILPGSDGTWIINKLSLGSQADVTAFALPDSVMPASVSSGSPQTPSRPNWTSEAVALAFDFPGRSGVQLGALMTPFRPVEMSFAGESVTTDTQLKIGALLSPLPYAPPILWDRQSVIEVYMPDGAWFAVSEGAAMTGGNCFAIETDAGWEILGAADITLVGEGTYRLKTLLRGLSNSDDMMMDIIPPGARVVALDAGVADLPVDEDFIGQSLEITATVAGRNGVSAEIDYRAADLIPLSVVHVTTKAMGNETEISWIPRNLGGAEAIDPTQQVDVEWPEGAMIVTGQTVQIPVEMGSDTPITLTPMDPVGGTGAAVTIYV